MEYFVICAIPYAFLFFIDIVPKYKKKQWKLLSFSIPVFVITLTFNILVSFDVKLFSITQYITDVLTEWLHIV